MARLTIAVSTPSWRSKIRSTLATHEAQVIPSTSKTTGTSSGRLTVSALDVVALILEGGGDGREVDGATERNVDGFLVNGDLNRVDRLQRTDRFLDRRLAVIA